MALPTDGKVYNMSTQYRRRKDLIVTERPSGELVVMERCRYYPPQPAQAPGRDRAPAPAQAPGRDRAPAPGNPSPSPSP